MYQHRILLLLILTVWFGGRSGRVHHTSHFNHVVDQHQQHHHHDFTPAPNTRALLSEVCPPHATCVPPVQCPAHVYGSTPKHCHLIGGRQGMCCTTGHNLTDEIHLKSRNHLVTVTNKMINEAALASKVQMSNMLTKESRLLMTSRSAQIPLGSASFGHFRNARFYHDNELNQVLDLAHQAMEVVFATRSLKDTYGYSNEELELNRIVSDFRSTPLQAACATPPDCPNKFAKHRNMDGSCNNLVDVYLGMIQTPFSRLLPPSYEDGIWAPRISKSYGQSLPSARVVSDALFSDVDRPDTEHTLMLMQFGQFLSHDVSRSITSKHVNGSGISCCTNDGTFELPAELRHYACMPIIIPVQDSFYKDYGQGCMNFVRSILAPRQECNLGYSQQMNGVSHFMDGSAIYGVDSFTTNELREYMGGRLKMFGDFGRDLLPLSRDPQDCLTMEQGSACFAAGDNRLNQMITLVAVHTLFAREHNRLAGVLTRLNPHWSDETLFLEARKILIGELQHIAYAQWLPEVIGHVAMSEFSLNVDRSGYSMDYNNRIDPSITNEFSTAALRFGHSIVDGKLKVFGAHRMEEMIDIPEVMFYPSRLRRREFFDEILSTLTTESSQSADTSVSDALSKYLFRAGNPFGMDLISINIQRGRDHGLRPYNDYRELTGLPRYTSFDDYGSEAGIALRRVYGSPEDVDLFVGGLIESQAAGSVVGPTFRDIIADQFSRLRKGDRYFYNLHPSINPGHFSPQQLHEIQKVSFARVICDNSDGIVLGKQAMNPFRRPGLPGNELLDCNGPGIPQINLMYWKENI